MYVEYCKGDNDLKPEFVLFAKIWQSKHSAEVQASWNGFLSQIKQVAPSDWTLNEAMPVWCMLMKNRLPTEARR
jgi:hypothetical protein